MGYTNGDDPALDAEVSAYLAYRTGLEQANYPVPTTLVSCDIHKQYVAFYHWTWLPNILRPLLVIYKAKSGHGLDSAAIR